MDLTAAEASDAQNRLESNIEPQFQVQPWCAAASAAIADSDLV